MSDHDMDQDEAATRAASAAERAYTAGWRDYRDGKAAPSGRDPQALRGWLEARHAAELLARDIQWSAGETYVVGWPVPETERTQP
jgi:hypothetical protein